MTELDERRKLAFSLPTQRCFLEAEESITPAVLFSAYAEVFPDQIASKAVSSSFLCLRRGVSSIDAM